MDTKISAALPRPGQDYVLQGEQGLKGFSRKCCGLALRGTVGEKQTVAASTLTMGPEAAGYKKVTLWGVPNAAALPLSSLP